ncbi:ABC transporter ATP-binding protein [Nitriliruptor alkaliphilus]|uniref:ABC transporter ATP-binding protein n=1 Tax=Nitriliruptor alkaliphilus TaxID=427918 RepID=UPI0009FA0365|nr:ABC transporter ATP-binding protein [Nitriliruptor alkaliphilus]
MARRSTTEGLAPDVPADATIVAQDLHVTYKVYEDRRPQLREMVANRGRRPSFREIKAVRGVDFVAREGQSIGIVGRNGSGKSTLLQAMAGLLPPDDGAVFARSQPSLLGVNAAMKPNASGRRNAILGGLALGLTREDMEERLPEIIRFTQLEDFIDLPMRTYSSGMRARLLFAIATSVEPDILMIDEALAVGDTIFQKRSRKRIKQLRENAGTVFLVSHASKTLLDSCDRVLWLERGQLIADGEPKDVIESYEARMNEESDRD